MPFNVMLQLCKITRASKLFQRNFYLPLLKPLSPKDALRRHILTGKNLLGNRIEHYIPVLEEYQARMQRRRTMVRGKGKKRQRKKEDMRYLMPLFDSDMDNHGRLMGLLARKSKGRGQCYTYYIPDKDCTLVFSHQLERAIRDHDILDVIIAQRSEKIVVKLANDLKVVLPLLPYDGKAPFYAGEGWTRKEIEEYHHHGKETMSIARLFEAKESGVEEWELEMMRLANKRKKKQKGEGTADWKTMVSAVSDGMDWDKFEDDAKQILEEIDEPVDDPPIAMAVDDMEKTKNVNEKLKQAGESVLKKLPVMTEIPELLKIMKDGTMTEMANVSGVSLKLPSSGVERFITGQMVNSEDGEIFVPGQTVDNEGVSEYTPGFTVFMDDEPTLLPGLVMGDDPNKPMFLPGESTITDTGELQFTETEDDIKRESTPPPYEEVEEVELEEEQNSEDEAEEKKPPPPKKKEFIYERPKRQFDQNMGVKRREKAPKKPATSVSVPLLAESDVKLTPVEQVLFDLTLPTFEKDLLLQEKERVEVFTEKKSKEEYNLDKKKREILLRGREIAKAHPKPKYVPLDPVEKSETLLELEKSIRKGQFFEVDHKKFLNKERVPRFNWKDSFDYRNTFDSPEANEMVINVKISLCKITAASKLFQRNYYLPLLKPLSPKDALRRKIITGQNVLGSRIEHYIPVLTTHDEKAAAKKYRQKGQPVIKKRIKMREDEKYVEPFFDDDMENHPLLQSVLNRKGKSSKGQHYVYEVPDRNCNVVVTHQMEKALKDKEVIDLVIAQRSEKVVVKLNNGLRITMPIARYEGNHPLYRGSGWTKEHIEEEHHHGKETFSIAKIFEAKESGVEEWELEMMRMANKRKKKVKGEDSGDWKQMMAGCLDNMDWDKFEEDTKQIIAEAEETVEEENIPMAVDDMEKTRNVNEKLKQGGEEVLSQLPTMKDIPEVIRNLETGDLCEIANVSGVMVKMADGKVCFVTGQMVKTDDNEVFVPGQTLTKESGEDEYTPGITVYMNGEPELIPGLVMGEQETSPMFLPGESTITDQGQLKFEATEEDLPLSRRRKISLSPSPPPPPKPRPKKVEEEIVIKRRVFDEPEEPRKEKIKKRAPVMEVKERTPPRDVFRPQRQPLDDTLMLLEEQRRKREEEERKRQKERNEEKQLKEVYKVDKLRMDVRKKAKEMVFEPPAPYKPLDPVKKSETLEELERSIIKGTFFEDERTKQIMENVRNSTRSLKYRNVSAFNKFDDFSSSSFGFSRR